MYLKSLTCAAERVGKAVTERGFMKNRRNAELATGHRHLAGYRKEAG